MKYRLALLLFLAYAAAARADLMFGSWTSIYKGVDRIIATNCPPTTVIVNGVAMSDPALQVVNCVRVDLTDPDVHFLTTPRASGWIQENRETLSLSVSNFIRNYKVQIASDANFYNANPGGSDPSSEGVPCEVEGFLVCTGQVVSPIASDGRYAAMLFKTNNEPSFNFDTRRAATDTNGLWTAVTGYYPVLTNGVNVWQLYYTDFKNQYSASDGFVNNYQPRTAFGISQDKRYLYMMTIDGRQPGSGGGSCPSTLGGNYSNGALDAETGMWMTQFGAWDAISMDGGGSTVLYMADCANEPIAINHSSLLVGGRERLIGCHFGVYAKALSGGSLNNVVVAPSDSTVTITWQTAAPGTTELDYGSTINYGNAYWNTNTTINHAVTLNGLSANTSYYFRVGSHIGGNSFTYACRATTSSGISGTRTDIFPVTKSWRWTSNNLDSATNWISTSYDDSSWNGPGGGLLYCENNPNVNPKITPLPSSLTTSGVPQSGSYVAPTYYFRTHFTLTNANPNNLVLYFTNYIDDGAVFYLNGTEIQRIRMSLPPTNIYYIDTTFPAASGPPCSGQGNGNDAACPDIFSISGDLVAKSLVAGDNLLAVEVHQSTVNNTDVTFGSALSYGQTVVPQPTLNYFYEHGSLTLYWNASGFSLQQATAPNMTNSWSSTGSNASPVTVTTSSDAIFYKLSK